MLDRYLICALALQRLPIHTQSPCRGVAAFSSSSFKRRASRLDSAFGLAKRSENNDAIETSDDSQDKETLKKFLQDELERVESLQEIADELEDFAEFDDYEGFDEEDEEEMIWSEEALSEIFGAIGDDEEDGDNFDEFDFDEDFFEEDDDEGEEFEEDDEEEFEERYLEVRNANDFRRMEERIRMSAAADLERALLNGVVPVSAGVGNECLPGDYGFDPLNLAGKDYFRQTQEFLLSLLPGEGSTSDDAAPKTTRPRPKALILRDLREAEIRHGRLAMLAAVFWPLQEMLDRLLLDPEQVGPILYGPVTLPYFPLLMTAIMLLLGYLDVYAKAVKEMEAIGDAYLPGDCFWDPLRILQGAPDSMKRNMQERELLNGRVAMLAFALFTWEEAITHLQLLDIGQNDLLLEPAYEVPFIQKWLDDQFSITDPEVAFLTPSAFDKQALKVLLEDAVNGLE